MDERDRTHPKVAFRMPAELIKGLRHYCVDQHISMSALMSLIARSVLNGDVVIVARNTQPWEKTE